MKVTMAKEARANREREILQHISAGDAGHPGRGHVLSLYDSFTFRGPNGTHDALVTEVLLPLDFVQLLYPDLDLKRMVYQILTGLAYLHQNGVVHGGRRISLHATASY